MAIKLDAKPNIEAPSVDYEFGSIRDRVGATPGTPVSREVYSDFHQAFEKLMSLASITHNGQPDNTTNGYQLVEALRRVSNSKMLENVYGITQAGTSNPTIQLLGTNMLPFSGISATRTGAGAYEVTITGGFAIFGSDGISLQPSSGSPLAGPDDSISCFFQDNKIFIKTFTSGTIPTDGILNNYIFSIRLYTLTV